MRPRIPDDDQREPATFGDHMAQADQARRLADRFAIHGDISRSAFWQRIADEKTTDAMNIAPAFFKP